MVRITEKMGEWLGWCPNAQGGKLPRTCRTEAAGHTADTLVRSPGRQRAKPAFSAGDPRYEHTQAGWVLIGAVGLGVLILVLTIAAFGPEAVQLIVLCIMVFVLAIMARLTVSVSDDRLRIRFGPVGLVRREWLLSEIVSATPVTNPWYYGYGIRFTPHGRLYNVSGRHAVEILLVSGTKVRIGTDEPDALCRAIRQIVPAGTGATTP